MDIKSYKEKVLNKIDDIADALDCVVSENFNNLEIPADLYWARIKCTEIKNMTKKLNDKER